jgi:chemotaxis protein CheC
MDSPETLAASIGRGITAAGMALGDLSSGRVSIEAPEVRRALPADVIAEIGAADRPVVGIYVGFEGGMSGHALLLMTLDGAARVSHHLLDDAPVDVVDDPDLARSALEELGNIVISAVLNELGRGTQEPIHPSVPQAVTDMAGAILDGILIDLVVDSDEVTLVRAVFGETGNTFDGWLLVLPRAVEAAELVAFSTAPA